MSQSERPVLAGVRLYTLVCLASAMAMSLPLLARDLGAQALIPAFLGMLLPLVRWRAGPILLILSFLWLHLADRLGSDAISLLTRLLTGIVSLVLAIPGRPALFTNPFPRFGYASPALDFILAASVVCWIASYCRLLSMTRNIFPLDRRLRAAPPEPSRAGTIGFGPFLAHKRQESLGDGREVGRLLLSVGFAVLGALIVFLWLSARSSVSDLVSFAPLALEIVMPDGMWRCILLVWAFGLVFLVANAVIGYFGAQKFSAEEAALLLQDTLWRQTRREQARLARWLAWAEVREGKRRARREKRVKKS